MNNVAHEMEASDRALAPPAGGGAGPHAPQPDPDERGREHGLRGGTGGTCGTASRTRVPALVREYGLDLQARLSSPPNVNDESLLETLAFAEGRLLSIHPFADFNGRVTRVWLREVLRRLALPPVRLVPAAQAGTSEFLAALQAADHNDWSPLVTIWRERFENEAEA